MSWKDPGCRIVCRPARKSPRVWTLAALKRVLKHLRSEETDDAICEAIAEVILCENRIDCGELPEAVEAALDALPESGILDEFLGDLLGTRTLFTAKGGAGPSMSLAATGKGISIISRLKWILWLFRAFSLLSALRDMIEWVNVTRILLGEVQNVLQRVCEEKGTTLKGGPRPTVCPNASISGASSSGASGGAAARTQEAVIMSLVKSTSVQPKAVTEEINARSTIE